MTDPRTQIIGVLLVAALFLGMTGPATAQPIDDEEDLTLTGLVDLLTGIHAELSDLRDRVTMLEERVAELEDNTTGQNMTEDNTTEQPEADDTPQ